MQPIYDSIGKHYASARRSDPDIVANIHNFLSNAESILNIGAGTGSYEPKNVRLVAVEPSTEMIKQRQANTAPAIQAFAELLPFKDNSFSHSMTVLSMHHWRDRAAAFDEIKRVTTERFIALTWDPEAAPFWLTEEYFPEIYEIDRSIFPSLKELKRHFPDIHFYPLAIPANCLDGFTAAYWARPEAYLNAKVRAMMSSFSRINNLNDGLEKLKADLQSGFWHQKYAHLLNLKQLDVGYTIAVWDV